ncbi:hypothetical protein AKJ08_0716 [Vulgatibacter incomptus]|uniref:Uncharacterized protein n=1 Tax=Vulgatibacter incomptus TaxID=1391653 RepID=A0A0K1PB26_9BACT|nr:hypothetical protein AKJ08_0716 [Vulgatibacter incomptus]
MCHRSEGVRIRRRELEDLQPGGARLADPPGLLKNPSELLVGGDALRLLSEIDERTRQQS